MAVYFIQDDGGEIKIGWSEGNPYRRLNAFRTGNPRELKLLVSIPGGREEEQALHERFADLRTRGEWFKPDARLLGFIEGMRYAHADNQPEPVAEDEESICGLTIAQIQVCAGYTMAYEAFGLAYGYARVDEQVRAELSVIRQHLASKLCYLESQAGGGHAISVGIRALMDHCRGQSIRDLVRDLLAQEPPSKVEARH